MSNDIKSILDERGKRYGAFKTQAEISQGLRNVIFNRCIVLSPMQGEALIMICHKIARICNGDPNYADSWQDIAGYAQLVVNELNQDPTK